MSNHPSTLPFSPEITKQATEHLEAAVRRLRHRILRSGGQPVTEVEIEALYPHAPALERLWLHAQLLFAQAYGAARGWSMR